MKKFWEFISSMGFSPDLSHEEVRRIKLLSRLNFITFLVLLFYLIVNLIIGINTFIPLLIITILSLTTNLFLLYKKIYAPAKHISMTIIAICIGFFTLFNGDTFSEAFFIPLVAMPLIVFKDKKISVFYLIALIILVVVLKVSQGYIAPLTNLGKEELMFFKILNVICSALIAYFLTFYFKAANEEYENILIKMNEEVSEKNREITDSIIYAKRIQDALITPEKYIEKSLNKLKDKDK